MTEPKNPRIGKCYELSAKFVTGLDECSEPREYAVLVHGSIQGGGYARNPHAWVELEGGEFVHDPVMDWTVPWFVYERMMNAQVYERYDLTTTREMLVETGTWGAWDEKSEEVLQAKLRAQES